MRLVQQLSMIGATVGAGLVAGLFAAFAYAVMPALRGSDDRTFVDAMQRINVTIVNGWFLLLFLGTPLLAALAAVLDWRGVGRPALPWLLGGLALYLVAVGVTIAVNVPLNDALAAAGPSDLEAARQRFETTWVAWNLVRALVSTAGLGSLCWALAVVGRTGG
ncbi:anthrone oxygenase family protein [Micromonospora schwarzwaldensis]|uniref:anthrone oxygenase family protein n=1 Tax=Micromonospora sp. DSM 45708 TaxID=3111767 RepID=UPI0031CEEFF9